MITQNQKQFFKQFKQFKYQNQKNILEILSYIKEIHSHHIQLNSQQTQHQQVNYFHVRKIKIDQKIFKHLQEIISQLIKSKLTQKFKVQTKQLINSLIQFYLDFPYFSILEIILKVLGAETKFQTVSKQYDKPKVSEQAVIALPFEVQNTVAIFPDNNSTLKIVTHNANDTIIQQSYSKNVQYFKQDDQILQKYLQSQFKTIKRQDISDFFTQISQMILTKLIDPILKKDLSRIAFQYEFQNIIWLQKLVQYISPVVYTYYLLHIFDQLSKQIQKCFESKQNLSKILKKQQYEQIIGLLRSIAQRWKDHPQYTNQKWQFLVQKIIVVKFLDSQISQKMLYSVKMIIDRCRRIQYSYSAITQEQMHQFLHTSHILDKIYRPENHPQVIIKGKQLYEYICKNYGLQQDLIVLLFNLIQKSHQNICKSLFISIQNSGQKNLQTHRRFIMLKIAQLPRSSCFYQQTFALIQSLILLSPQQEIQFVLSQLFFIIQKNYFNLKETLKHKALNIYFQVFIMIIEGQYLHYDEGTMGMVALKSALLTENETLQILMIDKFLEKMKENFNKRYGAKCKKILNKSIQKLFKQFHIYLQPKREEEQNIQIKNQKRIKRLELLKLLMDSYEKHSEVLLQEKQLLELIEQDSYFGRYIQYYSQMSQVLILKNLIKQSGITQNEKDVKNMIQSYYMITKTIKPQIFKLIKQKFMTCQQIWLKKELVEFICKIQKQSQNSKIQNLYQNLQKTKNQFIKNFQKEQEHQQKSYIFLGDLMLLKQYLHMQDQKGYGTYPAFKFFDSQYTIKIKVINMIDILNPTDFQIEQKNYKTLYDVMKDVLPIINKNLKQIKLKIQGSQKYITLNQLKEKLTDITPYRQFKLLIEQSSQCEWYDKSLLINKENQLNSQIILILKEIFSHYSNENNRLFKQNAIKIFQIATNTQFISQNDTRILHLYNNYSQNGEYLTVQQWTNFYYQNALINPNLVIDNLKKLGYGDVFSSANQFIQNFQIQENKARKFLFDNECQSFIFQIFNQNLFRNKINIQSNRIGINNKQLNQAILFELFQILKEMPINKTLLQHLKHAKFDLFIQNTNQHSIEQPTFSLLTLDSLEKYWYVSLICLKFYFEKQVFICQSQSQSFNKNYKINEQINSSNNQSQSWKHLFQQSSLYKTNILQVYRKCYLKLVESNQEINPIKLSYNHQLQVDLIQHIGKMARDSINIMDLVQTQIELLCPIQQQSLIHISKQKKKTFKRLKIVSLTQSFQQKLVQLKNTQQLILIDPKIVESFLIDNIFNINFSYPSIIEFHTINLMSQNKKLRQIYHRYLYLLSEAYSELKTFFYFEFLLTGAEILLKKQNQQPLLYQFCLDFQEYYKSLDQLILLETNKQIKVQIAQNLYKLLIKFINEKELLKEDNQNENQCTFQNHEQKQIYLSKDEQQNLCGILKCLYILVTQGILKQNLDGHYFQVLTKLFLSQNTRKAIFQILEILNSSQKNINFIYSNIVCNTRIKKNSKRKTHKQVGILNLGCICYINSVIQQLYHIQPFMKSILETPSISQKEPYFQEFQKIFYQLKYSQRQFIIPEEFCKSYKDYANNSINIKQQHDADEFLNQLLDKLQKTFVNSFNIQEEDSSVQKNFKGEMANIITCQNCFTNKIKIQNFYVLSLQIKNQTTLSQCLQNMIQPQIICDFYCNTCQKKVQTIHKYRKFQTLPKFLFIHFQRLVFDLQTFSKIKLDHPISFPQQIDFNKYFYDQQKNSKVLYSLAGFIVHLGTSQGGHYYSLIKNKEENKWIKLNDNMVDKWFWKTGIHQKGNAYLLIYEKKQQSEDQVIYMNKMQQNQNCHQSSKGSKINNILLNLIKIDNSNLSKQISILEEGFSNFLLNNLQKIALKEQRFIQLSNKMQQSLEINNQPQAQMIQEELQTFETQNQIIHLCLWQYISILNQAKNFGILSNDFFKKSTKEKELQFILSRLMMCQTFSKDIIRQFMTNFVKQDLVRAIFYSGQKFLRKTYSQILVNLVFLYQKHYPSYSYLIPCEFSEPVKKILLEIQNSLSEIGKNYLKMDEYFQTLLYLIKFNPNNINICKYFIANHLPAKLIHFIMQKQSPSCLCDKFSQYTLNAPSTKKIDCFTHVIQIIEYLTSQSSQQNFGVDQLASIALKCPKFYKKLINERYNNFFINKIFTKNCKNDKRLTEQAISITIQGLNRFNHEDSYIYTYIDLLYCQLKIKDPFTQYRTMKLLGVPQFINSQNSNLRQAYKIQSTRQRIVRYGFNCFKPGDQIMFPFLELLYTNKSQINYFTIFGTLTLLLLAKEQFHNYVGQFIQNLPSPCLLFNKFYSWIPPFINCILQLFQKINKNQKKNDLLDINLKNMVDRISQALSDLQTQLQQKQESLGIFQSQQKIKNQQYYACHSSHSKTYIKSQNWQKRNKYFILDEQLLSNYHHQKQNIILLQKQILQIDSLIVKKSDIQQQIKGNPQIFYQVIYTKPIHNLQEYCQKIFQGQINKQKFQQKLLQKLQQKFPLSKKQKKLQQKQISQNTQQIEYRPSLIKFSIKNVNQTFEMIFSMKNYEYNFIFQSDPYHNNSIEYQLCVPFPSEDIQNMECNSRNLRKIIQKYVKIRFSQSFNNQKNGSLVDKPQNNKFNKESQNKKTEKINVNLEKDFPTIGQVYHSQNKINEQFQFGDAFQQKIQNDNQSHYRKQTTNLNVIYEQPRMGYGNNMQPHQLEQDFVSNISKTSNQICIQCPFCGGFSYEYSSKCPSCGEQWGMYA